MNRIADRIAATLHAAGVRHAFGMPGGEVVTLLDALERAGIRFVLARNETAAAMMAAGASVVGGAPGLLVTTLGPGLANAVNGVADAAQERTPLLVISGVVERAIRARYTHQVVDHAAMLRPLVKASFEIEPETAEATIARALRLAATPPFGPVHLDLSPTTAALPAQGAPAAHNGASQLLAPDPADPAVAAVRDRLARAERPLLIAGFDAARGGAAAAIRKLADTRRIPVITTYKAKGVLDENHPCSLGGAGLSPLADTMLLGMVRDADLVLLAGYDPIEMRPGWLGVPPHPERVVELGWPVDHAMHEAGLRLCGDPAQLLAAVAQGCAPGESWPGRAVADARAALAHAFASPAHWGPHAVFETLAETAGDATVTVDSGAHRILLSQMWRASRPLSLLQSAGWCTMGSAIPLAIGAALAEPSRRAVAVLGDGGLEMTLGELGTIRDQALPITILVLQDESLGLIELKQAAAGLARTGVTLGRTDYAAVARAFGGLGVECRDRASVRSALAEAAGRPAFTLITCPIDARAYVDRI